MDLQGLFVTITLEANILPQRQAHLRGARSYTAKVYTKPSRTYHFTVCSAKHVFGCSLFLCPLGEQLDLVYAFSLNFLKDMSQRGVAVRCLAYDNACHLLQKARENRDVAGDISRSFASDLAIVLDNFHRDNHKWCLQHLPEVDPKHPANTALLAGKNTQACEQLNSWITHRTKSSLDMPPGRFQVFWWTILLEHNAWIQEEAAAARRRAARRASEALALDASH